MIKESKVTELVNIVSTVSFENDLWKNVLHRLKCKTYAKSKLMLTKSLRLK